MICYDIGENKPRKRLADFLEAHDFSRLQYSVFAGHLASERWEKLRGDLEKFYEQYCQEGDRIHSHIIDVDAFKEMLILGEALDTEWLLHETNAYFP